MVEVICKHCRSKKDSTFDFYWQKDGNGEPKRISWCKECMKLNAKRWHKKRQERVAEAKMQRYNALCGGSA